MYCYHCYGRRFGRRHGFTGAFLVLLACVPRLPALRTGLTLNDDKIDIFGMKKVGTAGGASVTVRNALTHHHYLDSTNGQHVAFGRKSGKHGPSHSVVVSAPASLSQGTVAVQSSSRSSLSGAHVLGLALGSALASWRGTHLLGLAFALLVISGTILVAGHARCASRHLSKPEDEPEGALNIESLEKQCFVAFCEPGDEKAQRQHIVSRLTSATPGTLIEQLALQRQFEKDSFLAADDDDTAVAGAALRRDAAGAAVEAAVASVEDSVRTGLSLNAARKKEDEISVAPGRVAPEAAAKRAAEDRPRISRGGDSFDHCFSAAQPDEKAQRQHMVSRLTSGTPGTFIEELSLQRQFSKSFLACDVDVTAVAGAALRRDAVGVAVEAAVASVEDSVRAGLTFNAARKKEAEIAMAPERVALEDVAKLAAEDRPRISSGEDPFDHSFIYAC